VYALVDRGAWVCLCAEEDGVTLVFRLEAAIKSYAVLSSVDWLLGYEDVFGGLKEIA